MARLDDLLPIQRDLLESLDCPTFPDSAFVPPRPLSECRVALISTAGLMQRNDDNIAGKSGDYRSFKRGCQNRDILMNHVSVNFDRTAFAADANSVLPRQVLDSLAEDKIIAKASDVNYSFMGATEPAQLQSGVEQLATELHDADINTVCLLPV